MTPGLRLLALAAGVVLVATVRWLRRWHPDDWL